MIMSRKRDAKADALQRLRRLEAHKMHTIALLASFSLRNKWINDQLLHVCTRSKGKKAHTLMTYFRLVSYL
jgi:hypothetical protein